jgi:hypothetical protein
MSKSPLFAPLPMRAIGDHRLTALHFRVLAAIASHDRLSEHREGGQGCWASNKTLAQAVGCDYTRLSTSITALASLGYIHRRPHPLNKRLRVYWVIYDSDSPADSLPNGKLSEGDEASCEQPTVCHPVNSQPTTVCRPNAQAFQSEEQSCGNIFREAENRFRGNGKDNSAGAALPTGSKDQLGANVAQFERHWRDARRRGARPEIGQVVGYQKRLAEICEQGERDDPTTQRACRLADELADYLAETSS